MSKTNPNSYYDIEFEVEEVLFRNGLVEDIFYLKDLKQRKLFIAANISGFDYHTIAGTQLSHKLTILRTVKILSAKLIHKNVVFGHRKIR